jgi:phage gp29-like protein
MGGEVAAVTVRAETVDADRRIVEDAMNRLIGWIWELNFTGERPSFSMWAKEQGDKARAEKDEVLHRMGMRFSKRYLSSVYNIPEEDFEIAQQPAGGPIPVQFAESTSSRANPVDQVDLVAERAAEQSSVEPIIDPIEAIAKSASTLEELRDKVIDAYQDASTDELVDAIEKAMTVANLGGQSDAAGRSK